MILLIDFDPQVLSITSYLLQYEVDELCIFTTQGQMERIAFEHI